MKSFEKEIKKRVLFQTIKAIIIGAIVIMAFIVNECLRGDFGLSSDMGRFIFIALLIGGEVTSIRAILKYRKLLNTPEALEALHIREADERNRIIILKTCQSTVKLTWTFLLLAGIVASFFSLTVFLTIGTILVALLLLYFLLFSYYSRKH